MNTLTKTEEKSTNRADLAKMLEPAIDVAKNELEALESPKSSESASQYSLENLSEEKRQDALALAEMIDISKTEVIMQYGTKSQRELSRFSDTVLSEVRLKDGGEAGVLLSELMGKVRKMDVNTLEQKDSFLAKLPVVGRVFRKAEVRMMEWENMQGFLEKVVGNLDVAKYGLLKDITKLDQMFEMNRQYFDDLNLYISAGELKVAQFEEEILAPLRVEAEANPNAGLTQQLQDMAHNKERFEKRIHDLKLSRTISQQMAPQIRVVQQNNQILAEKIESSVVNTIPLWKNQVVMALSLTRQHNALKAQQDVTNTTNALLEQNSLLLKTSSVEIAKENEKGIVSIESLKIAQQNLIETLDETLRIQTEGKLKRREAEQELLVMEQELKQKVLQIAQTEQKG